KPAGLLVHPVEEPRKFGIVFVRSDGTLEKLVEKPDLDGRQMANIGAYLFPAEAFDVELPLSPRGEYEITDAVSALAARRPIDAGRRPGAAPGPPLPDRPARRGTPRHPRRQLPLRAPPLPPRRLRRPQSAHALPARPGADSGRRHRRGRGRRRRDGRAARP